MVKYKEYDIMFTKIVKESQKKLLNYPSLSSKKKIKLLLKSVLRRQSIPKGKEFFWPNGLLVNSLEWVDKKSDKYDALRSMQNYFDNWIKKDLPIINADYAINGYSLIYVYNKTKEARYLKAIQDIVIYLKKTPKTKHNSIPYRYTEPNRVLIDNLGMVSPFLCRYYDQFQDNEALSIAIAQLENFIELGMDKISGLPYHGYDAETGLKLGIVGWGRALGWMMIGLVDSLEYIPKEHKSYNALKESFVSLVEIVTKFQDENGDYAWQVSLKESYKDTSSTSMISYAIQRGIMLQLIPQEYIENVQKSITTLCNQTKNGRVMNCSAECRGLGMYPQNYGNYPWSQGPTTALLAMRMLTE